MMIGMQKLSLNGTAKNDPSSGIKPEIRIPFIGKEDKCLSLLATYMRQNSKKEKTMGFYVLPKKNGINRWKQLRKACGLNDAGSNVPRRHNQLLLPLQPIYS